MKIIFRWGLYVKNANIYIFFLPHHNTHSKPRKKKKKKIKNCIHHTHTTTPTQSEFQLCFSLFLEQLDTTIKLVNCDSYASPYLFVVFTDLALHIFSLLPFLAECHDSYGYSALHILAQKPLSFRSGTSLGIVESIIYAGWYKAQCNHSF